MPAARFTDPQTSHEAAASVTNVTQTQQIILMILKKFGSMSDQKLVRNFGYIAPAISSESGIRSRRAELVKLGLVEDSGDRERLNSGRNAIIWKAA